MHKLYSSIRAGACWNSITTSKF